MAPPRGHPKWGGRRKGLSNLALARRELALQEAMAAALTPEQVAELSPLEVMRTVMRRRIQAGDDAGALAAAAVAAPYVHARLAMSEVRVQHSTAGRSAHLRFSYARWRQLWQQNSCGRPPRGFAVKRFRHHRHRRLVGAGFVTICVMTLFVTKIDFRARAGGS
jgi:hypothetical protein